MPFGALLSIACARGPVTRPVGVSSAEPEHAQPAVTAPAAPRQRWPDYEAALAWPAVGTPSPALGHRRDGSRLEVRVEQQGLAAYRELAVESPMPEGARVVAWLRSPRGAPLGGYLLEKRAGVWKALQLDAEGSVVPGDGAACLRCHELAPTDFLFGPPQRSPAAPAGAAESLTPSER